MTRIRQIIGEGWQKLKSPVLWFHSLTITASPLLYRAAVFGVTGCKSSVRLSVIFHFVHKNARQENSKFYSNLRNASS